MTVMTLPLIFKQVKTINAIQYIIVYLSLIAFIHNYDLYTEHEVCKQNRTHVYKYVHKNQI